MPKATLCDWQEIGEIQMAENSPHTIPVCIFRFWGIYMKNTFRSFSFLIAISMTFAGCKTVATGINPHLGELFDSEKAPPAAPVGSAQMMKVPVVSQRSWSWFDVVVKKQPKYMEIYKVSHLPKIEDIANMASLAAQQVTDDPYAKSSLEKLGTMANKLAKLANENPEGARFISQLINSRESINLILEEINPSNDMRVGQGPYNTLEDYSHRAPKGELWNTALAVYDALSTVQAGEMEGAVWNTGARAALAVLYGTWSLSDAQTSLNTYRKLESRGIPYTEPQSAYLIATARYALQNSGSFVPAPRQGKTESSSGKGGESMALDAMRKSLLGSFSGSFGCGINQGIEVSISELPSKIEGTFELQGKLRTFDLPGKPRTPPVINAYYKGSEYDNPAFLPRNVETLVKGDFNADSGLLTLKGVPGFVPPAPKPITPKANLGILNNLIYASDIKKNQQAQAEHDKAIRDRNYVPFTLYMARDANGDALFGTVDDKNFECNEFIVMRDDGGKTSALPKVSDRLANAMIPRNGILNLFGSKFDIDTSVGSEKNIKVGVNVALPAQPYSRYFKDYSNMLVWQSVVAAQGNSFAAERVGRIYEFGLGVDQDYVKAAQFYQASANANNVDGQIRLARLYANGLGVPKNFQESKRLQSHAATTNQSLSKVCNEPRFIEGFEKIIMANEEAPGGYKAQGAEAALGAFTQQLLTHKIVDPGQLEILEISAAHAAGHDQPFHCEIKLKRSGALVSDTTPYRRYTSPGGGESDNSAGIKEAQENAKFETHMLNKMPVFRDAYVTPLGGKQYKIEIGTYYDMVSL